jgi:hypothetical protein
MAAPPRSDRSTRQFTYFSNWEQRFAFLPKFAIIAEESRAIAPLTDAT